MLKRENSAIKLQAAARGKQARKEVAARRSSLIADQIANGGKAHAPNAQKQRRASMAAKH